MIVEETIMMIALPALAAWALWLLFRRHQLGIRIQEQRIETINRLIDKFGTAKELVDFLQTDAGRRLLDDPHQSAANPRTSVLRYVQAGIILTVLGAAFLISGLRPVDPTDINYIREAAERTDWATLFLSLGLGLWLVALVTRVAGKHGR